MGRSAPSSETQRPALRRSPEFLSLVVPVFNEEAGLVATVAALREGAERAAERFEIVLVDDASTDGTAALIDDLHRADPRVRGLRLPTNGRLGTALRAGFAAARGDVVLYADADLPFDPHEIGRAMRLRRLHQADLVCAWRLDRTSEGPRRWACSLGYNLLVRLLFGVAVRDVNFSFKLIRRPLLQTLELTSKGSFIDAEIVVRAHRAGARLIQFGTDYFPRQHGESRLSDLATVAATFREMLEFRL